MYPSSSRYSDSFLLVAVGCRRSEAATRNPTPKIQEASRRRGSSRRPTLQLQPSSISIGNFCRRPELLRRSRPALSSHSRSTLVQSRRGIHSHSSLRPSSFNQRPHLLPLQPSKPLGEPPPPFLRSLLSLLRRTTTNRLSAPLPVLVLRVAFDDPFIRLAGQLPELRSSSCRSTHHRPLGSFESVLGNSSGWKRRRCMGRDGRRASEKGRRCQWTGVVWLRYVIFAFHFSLFP